MPFLGWMMITFPLQRLPFYVLSFYFSFAGDGFVLDDSPEI